MSFQFTIGGHAPTKEAEEEIVRAIHAAWAKIIEHAPGAWSNAHTQNHGVGYIDALTDPDNPDKNVTTDEDGSRHLNVPVDPSITDEPAPPSESPASPSGAESDAPTSSTPSSTSTQGTNDASSAYPDSQ